MKLVRAFVVISLVSAHATASIVGSVRGEVVNTQRQPVAGVSVRIASVTSAWHQTAMTGRNGLFAFQTVPLGDYVVTVGAIAQPVSVASGSAVTLNLTITQASAAINVTASASAVASYSSTTQNTISRIDVQRAPGADRANSLAMITDFVPGAYIVHDQLHVRGGHQVSWLIDGVPVPNTNIGSNVGPQFDPRDVDYLETQRGGYSAEYGDRTYAVFNVVPKSGFERDREAHALLNYGSHRATDDQLNFGSHTDRFAYYTSVAANRSDAGLEPPQPAIVHDGVIGGSLFGSLVFLPSAMDQLRLTAAARADRYDVPSSSDTEREHDIVVNATWLRTMSSTTLVTIAPFLHTNSVDFNGSIAHAQRSSTYMGAEASYGLSAHHHNFTAGAFGFHQSDRAPLRIGSLSHRDQPSGGVAAVFAEDRNAINDRLTLRAGARYTRFDGALHESAFTPRVGLTFRAGGHATLRVSYTDVYQSPPLSTASGPLLEFAEQQGFGFLPLHGERDHQLEAGVAIPLAGWDLDVAAFRNHARNYFDHDALGNSNVFFPLTIERVFIRGAELTLHKGPLHVAYSHQSVQGAGGITGGLTDFEPPEEGRFFLDHDQRNTLSVGATAQLTHGVWLATNVAYGSGFLKGDGPKHLPGHATLDFSMGVPIGKWTAKLTALNVANKRYLLDESNTFGGTHWNLPRAIFGQIDYRFRY